MTIWRLRLACYIPRATNRHPEYVILIVFPLQQWTHERASMSRYTYTACLVTVYTHILQTWPLAGANIFIASQIQIMTVYKAALLNVLISSTNVEVETWY